MLLTSSEGLSCYLAPARVQSWGLRSSWKGEGREPVDGHLVILFSFSLNKCHFLREEEEEEEEGRGEGGKKEGNREGGTGNPQLEDLEQNL